MTSALAHNLSSVRSQRQISLSKLAELVGMERDELDAFEQGEKAPNRTELSNLALVLGTSAISLRSKREPKLKTLPVDFRTEMNRQALLTLPGARTVNKALKQVRFVNQHTGSNTQFHVPERIKVGQDAEKIGTSLREYFGVDDEFQMEASPSEFYRFISNRIQNDGCFIFRRPAPVEDFRGFTSEGHPFPLILINTKDNNSKAQLFTLCHEYVHLLLDRTGISDPRSTHNAVERFCNKVAISFLAPKELMISAVERNRNSLDNIGGFLGYISNQLNISHFASVLRLKELKVVDQNYVDRFIGTASFWKADAKKSGGRATDAEYDYGAANLWKFGARYITELGRMLDQNRISILDIEQHVGLTEEALIALLERASFEQSEAKSEVSRIEFDSFAEPLADYQFDVV